MLHFISSNSNKIDRAKLFLDPLGITFEPHKLELIEIQSESVEEIVIDKAQKAFEIINAPLLVNDHSWSITALNGFPGPYMKYMNKWFSPQDFLNIMRDQKNREIQLTEYICFTDGKTTKTFYERTVGHMLSESKGDGEPWTTVSSYSKDDLSVAEVLQTSPSALRRGIIYEKFGKWYKKEILNS
ncbi:XTP/dITP diphosphatase [soil metagenome]